MNFNHANPKSKQINSSTMPSKILNPVVPPKSQTFKVDFRQSFKQWTSTMQNPKSKQVNSSPIPSKILNPKFQTFDSSIINMLPKSLQIEQLMLLNCPAGVEPPSGMKIDWNPAVVCLMSQPFSFVWRLSQVQSSRPPLIWIVYCPPPLRPPFWIFPCM